MAKKKINGESKSAGKSLSTEKGTHELLARICGKSETKKSLNTYISANTKTFRDAFVLCSALGAMSNESLIDLPKSEKITTVERNDIKDDHDYILKAIAYWHEGVKEKNEKCHEVLLKVNEYRSLGEKYCYAGKEKLEELVNSKLFDSELIKYILNLDK